MKVICKVVVFSRNKSEQIRSDRYKKPPFIFIYIIDILNGLSEENSLRIRNELEGNRLDVTYVGRRNLFHMIHILENQYRTNQ